MKKRRLIGLVTLLMSLGVAGCFGPGAKVDDTKDDGYYGDAEGHYKLENGKKGAKEPHVYVPYEGDKSHVVTEATCDRGGKTYEICEVCKRINPKTTSALGHDLIDNGSTATCTQSGILSQKCSRCDYTKNEAAEALGHQWGNVTAVNEKVGKASCERSGCSGAVEYVVEVETAGLALDGSSAWKTNPSTGAFKLNKDGQSCTFTFSLPKAFRGQIYQRGYMDSYKNNYTKKLFYETNNHSNIEVTVNGSVVDMSAQSSVIFSDVLGNSAEDIEKSDSDVKDVLIGNVELGTSNTITYKRVETLNMIISAFVFVGTEA